MLFAKKAWSFLKRHWYVPVIGILGIVLWFVFRPAGSALLQLVQRTRERHKEEVDELEKTYREEAEKKKLAREEYQRAIDEAEQEHEEAQAEIEHKKKERIDELLERHKNDPDELTDQIAELGGFRVVDAGE